MTVDIMFDESRCSLCGVILIVNEDGEVYCPKCPGEWDDERRDEEEEG